MRERRKKATSITSLFPIAVPAKICSPYLNLLSVLTYCLGGGRQRERERERQWEMMNGLYMRKRTLLAWNKSRLKRNYTYHSRRRELLFCKLKIMVMIFWIMAKILRVLCLYRVRGQKQRSPIMPGLYCRQFLIILRLLHPGQIRY